MLLGTHVKKSEKPDCISYDVVQLVRKQEERQDLDDATILLLRQA